MKTATLALLSLVVITQIGLPATSASGEPWPPLGIDSGSSLSGRESHSNSPLPAALSPALTSVYLEARKLEASDGGVNDRFGLSVDISGETAIVGAFADDDNGSASGSAYIFERHHGTVDSWAEVAKLTASDAVANLQFGYSVGISGDVAVVGAFARNGGRGGVYVFCRDQGGADAWGQVKILVASDAALDDKFGKAVAISGDKIIVGALQNDDQGIGSGSAYIFQRDKSGPDQWGEVTKILPNNGSASDAFGVAVAISGDIAVVGANGEDGRGAEAGAAYIFGRDVGGDDNWGQVRKLFASDGDAKDKFGRSVAISGNTALVGAFANELGGMILVGSAYVFERNYPTANQWGEIKHLVPSDPAPVDQYGWAVAINDDVIIVGAFAADDACAGSCDSGKAYIYERNTDGPENWGEIQPVVASDGLKDEYFGYSIGLTSGAAIIGAQHKAKVPDPEKSDGAAYVFTRPEGLKYFKGNEPIPESDGPQSSEALETDAGPK